MPEKMVKRIQYECNTCHHKWFPRLDKSPNVCPVCKRTNWK